MFYFTLFASCLNHICRLTFSLTLGYQRFRTLLCCVLAVKNVIVFFSGVVEGWPVSDHWGAFHHHRLLKSHTGPQYGGVPKAVCKDGQWLCVAILLCLWLLRTYNIHVHCTCMYHFVYRKRRNFRRGLIFVDKYTAKKLNRWKFVHMKN